VVVCSVFRLRQATLTAAIPHRTPPRRSAGFKSSSRVPGDRRVCFEDETDEAQLRGLSVALGFVNRYRSVARLHSQVGDERRKSSGDVPGDGQVLEFV
jgi:hypothetical protein